MGWLKDVLSRRFPNAHTRAHWIRMAMPPKEAPETFFVQDERPAKGYNPLTSGLFLIFPLSAAKLGDTLMTKSAEVDSICPWCSTFHDRALHTGSNFATPKPGDVTICISCGQASVWSETLALRKPTKAETYLMEHNKKLQKALSVWAEMKGKATH